MNTVIRFQGMNIVSPVNLFWGASALDRAQHLRAENPEHADKYDWFIALCEAILRGDPLVPSATGDPDPLSD